MWPEALPPLMIIGGCIMFTGWALKKLDRWENNGKARRFRLDEWDMAMMKRDKKITGDTLKQRSL